MCIRDSIIPTMIMIYLAADVDYRKILKCTLVLQSAFMIVTVLASQMGVIEDVIWKQNGRDRQSLGYDYCGYPAHLMLFMTLMWFCIRQKVKAWDEVVWLGLNTLIYIATDSRADYYLSIFAIIGFGVISRFKDYREYKTVNFLMKYGCGVLAIFSILMQLLYDTGNSIWKVIDNLLNGRLLYGHQALQVYGTPISVSYTHLTLPTT